MLQIQSLGRNNFANDCTYGVHLLLSGTVVNTCAPIYRETFVWSESDHRYLLPCTCKISSPCQLVFAIDLWGEFATTRSPSLEIQFDLATMQRIEQDNSTWSLDTRSISRSKGKYIFKRISSMHSCHEPDRIEYEFFTEYSRWFFHLEILPSYYASL